MPKILIVDDSAIDRRLAGGILEKHPQFSVDYAADGSEALAHLETHAADLVVTDLQMPGLNGLELVEAIRRRWPLVPVILMTAHGSEDIAVAALEHGAASYVPKSVLARELNDTVENVLAVARADRRNERLLDCLQGLEASFILDNDAGLLPPLVDFLQDHVARMRLCDETGRIRLGIALEEALLNALYHGNLEVTGDDLQEASASLLGGGNGIVERRRHEAPYKDRRLHVRAVITPDSAQFVIRDEGPGFDPATLPDANDPANLECISGRGLMLMRTFMDEVRYNTTGNEVTLVKRCEPAPA
ncbi:MAG: response regulator [Pirellulales bacterium]|nr:response regulator [Pirellulales bacterium]